MIAGYTKRGYEEAKDFEQGLFEKIASQNTIFNIFITYNINPPSKTLSIISSES